MGSTNTTIYTSPIISLEDHITLSLPSIRFKIDISIIVSASFTLYIVKHEDKNYYN
ncbi:MAG: hypothetical protein LBG67_05615 [Campylobacteraceae bacterium]|nr:hypothetical protein [Campylobacteraceae bacterium]